MKRIIVAIICGFLIGTFYVSAQDSSSAPAPTAPSTDALLSKFTITMQTSLGGTLGTALSDKSLFIKALTDSGRLQDVSDFLSGTKVTVVSYADDDGSVSVLILDSGFKKNLLVKSTDPNILDHLDTREIFASIGPVLGQFVTYVVNDAGAYGIHVRQYFGITRKGQTCIFSFLYDRSSAGLGPITMILGSDEQYQIEGKFSPFGILFIPFPVDKLTGAKQTSSLIYSFFE